MSATDGTGVQHRRRLGDLLNLPHSALASHYRRKVSDLAPRRRFPRLAAFLPQNLWPWVKSYLEYVFRPKHAFAAYPDSGERGVYTLKSADGSRPVRISIAGDWGTGTAEAAKVARCMQRFAPDYTIHLGDVYYVGGRQEILENVFGHSRDGFHGVNWPNGSVGTFSLNSNHEMYANGVGYFQDLIPRLGVPGSTDQRQLTSFFCLQNEAWRIIALDTGYNSTGIPILGMIPPFRWIPGIGPTCDLEPSLLEWLRTVVDPAGKPRANILLSHHPYFSAFEQAWPRPASQLATILPKNDVIWIWGHEHRLAIYERYADGPVHAFGRCIGHGGMPANIAPPRSAGSRVEWYDGRVYQSVHGTRVGFNGHVNLTIDGHLAHFDYRDINDTSLLRESFEYDGGGQITRRLDYADPGLHVGRSS